ncbi:MAG: CPBP family intramembrane metalloprotease [Bacteroidales bacterium]|nr:CPBP family intramembrane metalloprotease [Candidatus Cacconaster equi]
MDVFKRYLPNLGECWILVVALLLGSIVTGLTLPAAPMSLTYAISMAFPMIYIIFLGRKQRCAAALNNPDFKHLGAFGAFAISALAMLCLMVVSEPCTSFIPMPESIKALFEKVFYNTPLWDSVLSTCILAPLAEEFLCRGIMMRGMLSHGSPARAIIWSAVIFAVMHANPWQSIPALIFGLFFGWIYYRTGCLWLTIFLHCMNNSISTVMARLLPDQEVDEGLMDIMGSNYWILFAVAMIMLAASIYFIYEKTVSSEVHSDSQREDLGQ